MTVKVLFFASLRDALNTQEMALDLSDDTNTSVRQLADRLEQNHKNLKLSGTLCAINESYAQADDVLKDGDTVAFFPPVSGG